jgi:prepilin-type N-terminal cleavage/methylation domain-containing protein/prepilin-type processing-associated H-X9-DG protein
MCRRGFTLVELIVVVSILLLLLALIIPAVQRVREASNIMVCKSNLRSIGQALLLYHQAKMRFPEGCTPNISSADCPYLGWPARLTPYLEADQAWLQTLSAFKLDRDFLNDPPHSVPYQSISVFVCPSDGRSQRPLPPKYGLLHYLGVGGIDRSAKGGTFYYGSKVRISDITDGCSNTVVVGERPPSPEANLGWWYAGWGQAMDGSCDLWLGVREVNVFPKYSSCPKGPYSFLRGSDSDCDVFHFWSNHSGGANFLFADFSVRFLSYSSDSILPALATIAGKEAGLALSD